MKHLQDSSVEAATVYPIDWVLQKHSLSKTHSVQDYE